MPRPSKRPREVIDLTGDEERQSQAKRTAPSSGRSSRFNPVGNSRYSSSPGGSSVYGASQVRSFQGSSPAFPSSATVDEPDVLDLTEDDDGPVRELYGTFGAFAILQSFTLLDTHLIARRWQNCGRQILQWLCLPWRSCPMSQRASKSGMYSCSPFLGSVTYTPQYDRNAIQVVNVFHEQIGHLPRQVVEKLAPYVVWTHRSICMCTS